jgi:hypothetical protein
MFVISEADAAAIPSRLTMLHAVDACHVPPWASALENLQEHLKAASGIGAWRPASGLCRWPSGLAG